MGLNCFLRFKPRDPAKPVISYLVKVGGVCRHQKLHFALGHFPYPPFLLSKEIVKFSPTSSLFPNVFVDELHEQKLFYSPDT